MNIYLKKLDPEAKLPQYAHPGDVGMDFFSLEAYTLKPGEQRVFKTGIAMEFPIGFAAIVKDKGGMANAGIHTMGGVFDAGYRGEYLIQLINHSDTVFSVEKGRKIAQIIIFPVEIPTLEEVEELSESARGEGRYGSTGKF
ncbi:MAG: dUTP diphosphatase [Candidatus Magasanikbacteria bacterium CG10_big_fil_rev_8_21_14_0_10_42_10]|uniref:dUTP diphosphatase n=2 Tax=Candidatus Magasanikiibacteriota TaxID=1752731 RepID=A0A2H0TW00_9BACT|nr:MAG: dUTP diphosphatase [Candidatus Magasanikbacteria bacterium CG10_big_fil_rev_8_21_14_0_10_42_10]PIZ94415.1 MAG: dUTP diphosphatase [Candidatus Magasanikbacteria bacterium CG_4_10_14_0_2_um_filter_41_10]